MSCEYHWDLDQILLEDLVNLVNIDMPTLATSVSDSINLKFVNIAYEWKWCAATTSSAKVLTRSSFSLFFQISCFVMFAYTCFIFGDYAPTVAPFYVTSKVRRVLLSIDICIDIQKVLEMDNI